MERVIDGKRYDTETAKLEVYWSNGYSTRDFKFRTKRLYRTKNGAWFLNHEGGAMSDLAVSTGNTTTGSESIESISDDDAFGFCQAHSEQDDARQTIEKYFADRVEEA